MSGQWRTFGGIAIAAALLLSGCAAAPGSSPHELCDLPATGHLDRHPDGGFRYTYPNGSESRLTFANGRCVLTTQRFIPTVQDRTEWELGFMYDYYITKLGPCLNGLGYPILAPPERTAFIESGGAWSPYDAVASGMISGSTIAYVSSVCPRRPPGMP